MPIQFIPAKWLEQSAWAAACGEKLLCFSRSVTIERRLQTERTSDVERLLKSAFRA